MPTSPTARNPQLPLIVAVSLATALAAWLRTYGITGQIVIDDEWHAIHKLVSSTYPQVLRSFGLADHSIPLTVFYKLMAGTFGLAEGRLRAPQALFGIALVPVGAWLAWRATRDAPVAALFAFALSGAPFLVMWSRFARPYAISLLLIVISLAALWAWRTDRTRRLEWWAALTAGFAAWLHPLMGLYPALACIFIFLEDVAAPGDVQPRPSKQSLELGVRVGATMLVMLAWPLFHDLRSLRGKAGGDQPDLGTLERMVSIFFGGLPTPWMLAGCALAALGLAVLWRRQPRLAAFLLVLLLVPGLFLMVSGALWLHAGQNFARYTLPAQPMVLFLASLGAIATVRAATRGSEAPAWLAATALSAGYLYATPAIAQVATLGPWYAHLDYHWDYRHRWMEYKRNDPAQQPPPFYRELGRMAPGSAPVIEAPYTWEAPFNKLAWYATFHSQPVTMGMLHDLCLEGDRRGEPVHDRRFRFRKFVFLDDAQAVRQTGARYLLLHREPIQRRPFHEYDRCVAKLSTLYGAPVQSDDRLAVFALR